MHRSQPSPMQHRTRDLLLQQRIQVIKCYGGIWPNSGLDPPAGISNCELAPKLGSDSDLMQFDSSLAVISRESTQCIKHSTRRDSSLQAL